MRELLSISTIALALAVSACSVGPDLGGLGAGIGCGFASFGDGLGALARTSTGGTAPDALVDDQGSTRLSVQGFCGGDDCSARRAMVGAKMALAIDYSTLAVGTDAGNMSFSTTSTDSSIVQVDADKPRQDPCSSKLLGAARVNFVGTGRAAIAIHHADKELTRFTFDVSEAASLELLAEGMARPPAVLQIQGAGAVDQRVRGTVGAGFSVRSQARDEMGNLLLTGGVVHISIDDPEVAAVVWPAGGDGRSGSGPRLAVQLKSVGSTTLRAGLPCCTPAIAIDVEPALDSSASDAGLVDAAVEQ